MASVGMCKVELSILHLSASTDLLYSPPSEVCGTYLVGLGYCQLGGLQLDFTITNYSYFTCTMLYHTVGPFIASMGTWQ